MLTVLAILTVFIQQFVYACVFQALIPLRIQVLVRPNMTQQFYLSVPSIALDIETMALHFDISASKAALHFLCSLSISLPVLPHREPSQMCIRFPEVKGFLRFLKPHLITRNILFVNGWLLQEDLSNSANPYATNIVGKYTEQLFTFVLGNSHVLFLALPQVSNSATQESQLVVLLSLGNASDHATRSNGQQFLLQGLE
jgi:hypothetical protein